MSAIMAHKTGRCSTPDTGATRRKGLAGLRDRSQRPLHCPHETPAEAVGKDHLSADQLPLRPGKDLHGPQALPRHRDQQLRDVADPQARTPVPAPSKRSTSVLQWGSSATSGTLGPVVKPPRRPSGEAALTGLAF